jgi:hypothetical protein
MITRRRLVHVLPVLLLVLFGGLAVSRLPAAPPVQAQPSPGAQTPTPTPTPSPTPRPAPAPVNVFTIPSTGQVVRDSSVRLLTNADGITAFVQTTGLPAGRYTLRWIVFNNPQACAGSGPGPRCGAADVRDPEVRVSAIDTISATSGGGLNLRVRVNTEPPPAWQVRAGPGLVNPTRAEIQLELLNERGLVQQIASNLRPTSAQP